MGEACQELVPRLIGSGELSAEEGEEGEKEFWMLTEWHSELPSAAVCMLSCRLTSLYVVEQTYHISRRKKTRFD